VSDAERKLWFDDLPTSDLDDPEAAAERAARRAERMKRRSGAGRKGPGSAGRGRRSVILGLLGAAALLLIGFVLLFQPFKGDGEGRPFTVKVPAGIGVSGVADLLAERGVISSATLFEVRTTISGKRSELFFGAHQFRKDMSFGAALAELGKAPQKETVTVVIPEGLSRSETADVVAEAGIEGDYMKASISSPILKPNDYGAQGRARNLEGFLFPATYELSPGDGVGELVDQQLEAFEQNIGSVDLSYAKSKNLNVYDVLTIASMVEREVSVARERPLVAAVIYNRLSRGEPLFIDATIRFATDNWDEPLTVSELEVDSPYNTRLNGGLPPGPIGSPGLASIEAAARPAETDDWLYVVKPGTCGEHAFSDSLSEHNRNVARYEQAREEAGGSPTECG
jgi:UPF0755 protein